MKSPAPERMSVNNALNRAIRSGKVQRGERCEACGRVGKLHGHHDDYSAPLLVRWLCPACHKQFHMPGSVRRDFTELGRRILERLESKGWSQSRLARELGVTAQAVSGILRQSYISAPLALRLSDLLGVTVAYLAPER